MVLGTRPYKRGIRATMFARTDKGIGWLVGDGDDAADRALSSISTRPPPSHRRPRPARCASRPAAHRPRRRREPRRRARAVDLLADVAAAFAPDEDEAWSRDIVARLAELRPDGLRPVDRRSNWPPRSSRTASAPCRCGAPTRRAARAPTAAATSATPSPPPRTTERNQSQRLGAVRVLDRTAPRPRPLLSTPAAVVTSALAP